MGVVGVLAVSPNVVQNCLWRVNYRSVYFWPETRLLSTSFLIAGGFLPLVTFGTSRFLLLFIHGGFIFFFCCIESLACSLLVYCFSPCFGSGHTKPCFITAHSSLFSFFVACHRRLKHVLAFFVLPPVHYLRDFFFSLSPSLDVTQIKGHQAGSSPSLPTAVRAFHYIVRRIQPSLFPLVELHRTAARLLSPLFILPSHAFVRFQCPKMLSPVSKSCYQ